MPMKTALYPPDWKQISLAVRARAGNKCQQCGLANGEIIQRSAIDGSRYIVYSTAKDRWMYPSGELIRLSEMPDEYSSGKVVTVVLIVHHIGVDKEDGSKGSPHDKMDCRDENLRCLCCRCHLLADMPTHIENARKTRLAKRAKAVEADGQLRLF